MGAIMNPDMLLALAGLAVSMTWTPGPNNVMLAASGANFGWRRTVPHAIGVAVGFPIMLFLIAMGLGEVFAAEPRLARLVGWLGLGVMFWFAWRIAMADPAGTGARARPLSFIEAVGFQWLNPKGWAFAIVIAATYATGPGAVEAALAAAFVFFLSGLGSSQAWAILGARLGGLLGTGWRLRAFNICMAALLVGSAVWLVAGQ